MSFSGNKNQNYFPILGGAEAAAWDNYSINEKKVDSRLLMGWAGYSVFLDLIRRNWFAGASDIHLFAGSGNNGGDGYVIAWHILTTCDKKIHIWKNGEPQSRDAEYFHSLCSSGEFGDKLSSRPIEDFSEDSIQPENIIIDAIFGTGLNKPPSENLQRLFIKVNKQENVTRIAVDIPSGVFANGDLFSHEVFHADFTYTFGSYKIAHLIEPGINVCGELIVSPIGFAPYPQDPLISQRRIMTASENILYLRKPEGHKYSSGVLRVIGGSEGMEGAAAMTAKTFLSLGGGLGKIYSTSGAMVRTLQDSPELMIRTFSDTYKLEENLRAEISNKSGNSVIVIGVGLGDSLSENFWKMLTSEEGQNIVIDGSGLSQLPSYEKYFKENCLKNLALTPHKGEAERLLGRKILNVRQAALEISERYNAHVYLKGPGGILVLKQNNAGNVFKEEVYPASKHFELSVGGTGDVLCGVIANFLCRYPDNAAAAMEYALATYLQTAQNVVEKNHGNHDFLTPSELIAALRSQISAGS